MMSNPEQSSSTEIVEKRKLVTAAQCMFNIVLYGAYGWALARFALHHSGWSLFLFGLWGVLNFVGSLIWISYLRRIRGGDWVESVFAPVEERKSFIDTLFDRFCWTSIAIFITVASIYILGLMGATSSAVGTTILLANIAAWRGAYHAWARDRAYKEPKVKFASEESIERAKLLAKAQKAPVAVGASAERTAGHWWTDTQLREENKSSTGR